MGSRMTKNEKEKPIAGVCPPPSSLPVSSVLPSSSLAVPVRGVPGSVENTQPALGQSGGTDPIGLRRPSLLLSLIHI